MRRPWFLGKDYSAASKQYEWKANQLIGKAIALGLLIRSTEVPRGHYEKLDALSNPSYDLGPNVFSIGKHAAVFLEHFDDSNPPTEPVSNANEDSSAPDASWNGQEDPLW